MFAIATTYIKRPNFEDLWKKPKWIDGKHGVFESDSPLSHEKNPATQEKQPATVFCVYSLRLCLKNLHSCSLCTALHCVLHTFLQTPNQTKDLPNQPTLPSSDPYMPIDIIMGPLTQKTALLFSQFNLCSLRVIASSLLCSIFRFGSPTNPRTLQ